MAQLILRIDKKLSNYKVFDPLYENFQKVGGGLGAFLLCSQSPVFKGERRMYWFARNLLFVVARMLFRLRVSGAENIPDKGAFVLCSNHIHSYDPVILAVTVNRQLGFIAKKELFKGRFMTWLLLTLGAFPVNRGAADMTTYRNAIQTLKVGKGLLVFSQGTRMQTLDVKGAKGGAAFFGVKAKVPVVPVGIRGSYRFFSTIHINYGKPISLEKYYEQRLKSENIDSIMTEIMSEVGRLAEGVD